MADVESGMAEAVAEPDNCGRLVVTIVVGVAMLSFLVLGYYLIGPENLELEVDRKPINTFPFAAGIICFAIAVCFYILFGGLLQEWEVGHPEGRRLVDKLLA
jgi:hypothetical protein